MKTLPLIALVTSFQVLAQTPQTDFPADAVPLAATVLQEKFAGKDYSVKPATGFSWSWQFKTDGTFYLLSGSFSDNGKWSIQEGKLCTEGRKIPSACNEIRQGGDVLYMKRDSGEIVKLSPK